MNKYTIIYNIMYNVQMIHNTLYYMLHNQYIYIKIVVNFKHKNGRNKGFQFKLCTRASTGLELRRRFFKNKIHYHKFII